MLCIVALHTQVWMYFSFCVLLLMILEMKLKYTEVHNKYRKGFSEISSVSITVSLISNNSVELVLIQETSKDSCKMITTSFFVLITI